MPSPKVPCITALGTAEKVVDLAPIHLRMAAWSGGRLDIYPGAEHEVPMELPVHRGRFLDEAAKLFAAHR
jgi:lysophospholipase